MPQLKVLQLPRWYTLISVLHASRVYQKLHKLVAVSADIPGKMMGDLGRNMPDLRELVSAITSGYTDDTMRDFICQI